MITKLLGKLGYVKKPDVVEVPEHKHKQTYTSDTMYDNNQERIEFLWNKTFQNAV